MKISRSTVSRLAYRNERISTDRLTMKYRLKETKKRSDLMLTVPEKEDHALPWEISRDLI